MIQSLSRVGWTLSIVLAVGVLQPVILSGCGSSGNTQRRPSDKITEEEVRSWSSTFTNAYAIVEQLRPRWLRVRGRTSLGDGSGVIDYVVVYEDDLRLGDTDQLRLIPAQDVREMEYYGPGRAIPLGPPDSPHGAIIVRTKKR